MADDLAMVERIYAVAALPMTTRRARRSPRSCARTRAEAGQVVYDLRRDFGAEPAAVRERFAFYFDRFPVKTEDDMTSRNRWTG